jgi:hypothetical protein
VKKMIGGVEGWKDEGFALASLIDDPDDPNGHAGHADG